MRWAVVRIEDAGGLPAIEERFEVGHGSWATLKHIQSGERTETSAAIIEGMRFEIVTIFPGFFTSIFENGIVRRALAEGLVEMGVHDLREFTHDRHRTVDDRPFGGGEGMVLKPEPLAEALEALGIAGERDGTAGGSQDCARTAVILLSAQGRRFTQAVARELAGLERVVLVCGRYEGVDERINELYCDMELSIGDYVLSGGELAAAVVVDATMRLIPGVLGNEASGEFESFGVADAEIDSGCGGGSAVAARGGRAAGLSALHAAGGVCAGCGAGGAAERRSPADSALAAGAAVAQDADEPAGSAGGGGAEQGRPADAGGDAAGGRRAGLVFGV